MQSPDIPAPMIATFKMRFCAIVTPLVARFNPIADQRRLCAERIGSVAADSSALVQPNRLRRAEDVAE
jgi:hypothetical protein